MILELDEEEAATLARLLRQTIDVDRYPLSPRIPREDKTGAAMYGPIGAGEALCAAARRRETTALAP